MSSNGMFESNTTTKQYDSAYVQLLESDKVEEQSQIADQLQDPWRLNSNGTVTITINETTLTVNERQWSFLKDSISFSKTLEQEMGRYEAANKRYLENNTPLKNMLADIVASQEDEEETE